jgi:DNA polymerase-3 subunit beta
MKLIVSKSALEDCVKNLVRVINPKNAMPILGDILFEVNMKQKTAHLTASDGEVTMIYEVVLVECEGEGRFCVSARLLADMLGEVSEQPVTITATTESDNVFTMTYQDGSAFCPIENADEYPMPSAEVFNETLEQIDGGMVCTALKRTIWATANDDLRPVMSGVNFALVDGKLDIVASNGHLMMKTRQNHGENIEESRCGSFIMPKKVAMLLMNVVDSSDLLEIGWNDRQAHIYKTGRDITFRLIEGKYPNYNAIIPQNPDHEVACQRTALLSALKAVAPFAPNSSQLLKLTFTDDKLEVSGEDYDFAQGATKSISVEHYDTNELSMSIGLKSSSIIGMLSKLNTLEVVLLFNTPDRPIVIEPVDEDGKREEEITGLLMPMLIND